MKTILVIYTYSKLTTAQIKRHLTDKKAYAFNTTSKVKVGTMFESANYTTPMQVIEIAPKLYQYYNNKTDQLSNKANNSLFQHKIKTLVIKKKQAPKAPVVEATYL